jgi:antitoxin component YwqK of YwqJK toxin-antitoxin module
LSTIFVTKTGNGLRREVEKKIARPEEKLLNFILEKQMNKSKIFILIFFLVLKIHAQDQTNFIDAMGNKQGKWIVYGKTVPGSCYQPDQIVEEGEYKNNNKVGKWTEYHCNKNLKGEFTYVDGKADGASRSYFENGKVEEEGTWKDNHWIGEYKKYTSEGDLKKLVVYDQYGNPDPAYKDKFFPQKEEKKPVEMDIIDSQKIIQEQSAIDPNASPKDKEKKKPFFVNPK